MQEIKPLTLRRNFSWTFIGNTVYVACQWGMLVVLAKLGRPEMVGQFTLGLAVTAPVVMLTNLQLRVVQATDAKKEYLFGDYLALRIIGAALALLVISIILLTSQYRWETCVVIFLVGLAKICESISDIFHGLIQQHERMDRIAISLIIKGPLSLLLLGIGVFITGNLLWGVIGLVFAWLVVLISYDIPSGAEILNRMSKVEDRAFTFQPRWHLATVKKLAWLCFPLGFVMMLVSLNTNIPRYFIAQYLDERSLGIFAALAYLMVGGKIVVNALAESSSPRLAKYYAQGNGIAFRKLLLKLVGIAAVQGVIVILVAVVGGKEILTILYKPEYAQHADLFVLLMIAATIDYISTFLSYGMTAARYFRIQMPLLAAVSTISAIACLFLIPIRGLHGAAIALIIATLFSAGGSLGVILYALHKLKSRPYKEQEYDII
ncbi:polysaccharide biosynthesis protein [Nostoc sp. T09]|uniref:oligosaccharide flippase family protein n=1 Tax=Nostoc sp. T09 TaxID=1932621 RepID=UPI000A3BEB3D|nr:oligosaccharide flippase family protein [Nostoc sp. T09]OUL36005.1 polysaccharide biosynthesis protein [Nostoc sp. T09]